MWGLT